MGRRTRGRHQRRDGRVGQARRDQGLACQASGQWSLRWWGPRVDMLPEASCDNGRFGGEDRGPGTSVGTMVVSVVGTAVGTSVGMPVGPVVGTEVGTEVKTRVGTGVGVSLGAGVGSQVTPGAGVGSGKGARLASLSSISRSGPPGLRRRAGAAPTAAAPPDSMAKGLQA